MTKNELCEHSNLKRTCNQCNKQEAEPELSAEPIPMPDVPIDMVTFNGSPIPEVAVTKDELEELRQFIVSHEKSVTNNDDPLLASLGWWFFKSPKLQRLALRERLAVDAEEFDNEIRQAIDRLEISNELGAQNTKDVIDALYKWGVKVDLLLVRLDDLELIVEQQRLGLRQRIQSLGQKWGLAGYVVGVFGAIFLLLQAILS